MAGGILDWLRRLAGRSSAQLDQTQAIVAQQQLSQAQESPSVQKQLATDQTTERALLEEKVRTALATGRLTFLPYLDNSQHKETDAHRRAYREMLRDPSVKSSILDKVFSVAALDPSVTAGDERPEDKQAAKFGDHLLRHVKGGLVGLVETIILPGLLDGFSVAEKVWALESRGPWKGKILLKALKGKDINNVQFELDEFRNITGVRFTQFNAWQTFHPSNFVIWKHLSLFDNPAGMSDLRAAYRAYWLIDTAWKIRMIYLEKYAAGPFLKGTYSQDPQKAQLEAALKQAKANTYITLPEGALVDAMDLASRGTSDFQACIKDLMHEVFLGVSGAILQSLEGTTTEGRGNSSVHKSTADIRKWHLKAWFETVVNEQIFPDAIDLNFPQGVAYPRLTLGGVNDTEMQSSMQVDQGLNTLGVELSKKDLRERYGRPEPIDDQDAVKPAAGAAGLGLSVVDPLTGEPPADQAAAVAGNDLRTTVGGLQAIAALQGQYYSQALPREAAVANVKLLFGFTQEEAEALFPPIAPNAPAAPTAGGQPGAPAAVPADQPVTPFCGGPGSGKPGPCPQGGGGTPAKRTREEIAQKARDLADKAKAAIADTGAAGLAKAKQVGAAASEVLSKKVKEFRSTLPETLATASLGTAQDWIASTEIAMHAPVPGLQTAMTVGSWAASKAIVSAKRMLKGGISRTSERFAEDLALAVQQTKALLAELREAMDSQAPLPSDAEIEAMLQARLESQDAGDEEFAEDIEKFCGGPGSGRPGPCPTGRKAAPTQTKIKAAADKVAKIDAKVKVAKAKLDGLKGELKAAKVDLAGLKASVKAKAAAGPSTVSPASAALANEVKGIYHPGAKPDQISGAVAKLQKGKRSDAVAAAEAIGIPVRKSDGKGKLIAAIQQRIEGRVGASQRMGMITVDPKELK